MVQARFLLGPSGSGKTFRCVAEAAAALRTSPSGPPLIFLSPKQATFQLERQLLAEPGLRGFTRLQILSFERLAEWILAEVDGEAPRLLNNEGRLMVLRALLAEKREELRLFRATARLRGFAEELSRVLRELQRARLSPEDLLALAGQAGITHELEMKLQDLASLLKSYLAWLDAHQLQDEEELVGLAAKALARVTPGFHFGALWMDGFAELAPREMDFLAGLLPLCSQATLAFNIDRATDGRASWMSAWATPGETVRTLRKRLEERGEIQVRTEWLERNAECTRFAENPALQHLERQWANSSPQAFASSDSTDPVSRAIRLVICANPDAEVALAAREIRQFVRNGGRFREAAVIIRNLEAYHDPVRRVFQAFEIPHFLDRREPVGHHPLSELTRSALRTLAFRWQTEDWLGALKTGLAHSSEEDIDLLENEALARGWNGNAWLAPLKLPEDAPLRERLEGLRLKLAAPFQKLDEDLGPRPDGERLAEALAAFWTRLGVAETLRAWSTRPGLNGAADVAALVHSTLWERMLEWLDNLALAFANERLTLREWLPIIEAGLGSQTVGVIPPTLDQVLVGSVERSRNPDLKLALVLGMNEGVFPARPDEPNLLTSTDREQLIERGARLSATTRRQLAQEQYLGYIACTRARNRLVITSARRDSDDRALNPSSFIDHLRRLFPSLQLEAAEAVVPWTDVEHASELLGSTLERDGADALPEGLAALPGIAEVKQQLAEFRSAVKGERLSPVLAHSLYGPVLETSVSRLEEFASCPFRFAITCGLHAEEREIFRLDAREQGSFQHEVLARFHQQLRDEKKRWRDLTPAAARQQIGSIASSLAAEYRDGLFQSSEQARFTARALTLSLQDFIETVIHWMAQYEFEPAAVELAFGLEEKPLPAWEVDLGGGHRLSFRGKIDRVDLFRDGDAEEALCVVIDYKSSARRLDQVLVNHGIQLQLLGYLNVLRALQDPQKVFGVRRLVPAGVFFVNLRGKYSAARSRAEAFEEFEAARALAYQHTGRFDVGVLRHLDNRGAPAGDQFNYRLRKNGELNARCCEPIDRAELHQLLEAVDGHLIRMGREIYSGCIRIDPYRKGTVTACDKCEYHCVCRVDPWTHEYRSLDAKAALCATADPPTA